MGKMFKNLKIKIYDLDGSNVISIKDTEPELIKKRVIKILDKWK